MKRHQALIALLLTAFVGNLVYTVIATDRQAFAAAVRIRLPMLGLAAVLAVLPGLCSALRVFLWLRFIRPDLRYAARVSLRAVLAAEVGAAMTPTAVGGAPVKVTMLVRSGLTAAEAVTVTAAGGIEDAVVIAAGLPFALVATGLGASVVSRLQGLGIRFLELGVLVAVAVLLVLAGAVVLLSRRGSRARSVRERLTAWWREAVAVFDFLRRRGRRVFAKNLALAGVHWAARLSIITALLAGLGIGVQPLSLAVLQWVCFVIMTVTPTPGAIGGAEASFLYVFADYVPAAAAPVALAAWRFVTFYALTGMAALLLALPIWGGRGAGSLTRPARATT